MDRPRRPLGDYYQLLLKNGLLADSAPLKADLTRPVPLVSCDSQVVVPGALFICKGAAFKEAYLLDALGKGAVAYVSEREYPAAPGPCILVKDVRSAMGLLANAAWGHPSGAVEVVGITGTKGKTTTAYYLRAILNCWRQSQGKGPAALLSTLVTDDGVERAPAKLTTPEPLDLQRHLFNAAGAGCGQVVMEVSSQALKYRRMTGVDLAVAVFLNIGEDHISPVEHPDFEDYFSSKLRIFSSARAAVVNLDCDHVERVLAAASVCPKVLTFSRKDPAAGVYGYDLDRGSRGSTFTVRTPSWTGELTIPMAGDFNVENALAAVAAAELLGVPQAAVVQGLADVTVPGRMETYRAAGEDLAVVVDYAHNGMSLEALLSTVRESCPGRELTVVFGCTGGKGLDRREGMAHAAARWADRIILTEDDPGPENVEDICAEICRFLARDGKTAQVIPDREQAVETAVSTARTPAVVVLAGKGAETVMKRKNGPEPCVPDGMLAQKALARREGR